MAYFDTDLIERLRETSNLVDIIGASTELHRRGDRWMGRCPFPDHKEKTPSFTVSESKQLYYCFGCKKSGDIFSFLMNYNGMTFVEAIEFLAAKSSISLTEYTKNSVQRQSLPVHSVGFKDLEYRINALALQYFQIQLKNLRAPHPAYQYLQSRKFSPQVFEKFLIGYGGDSWHGLTQFLRSQNADLLTAQRLGLIRSKKKDSSEGRPRDTGSSFDEYYDVFRERLIFPILSVTQQVHGFGGRVYLPEKFPKYLNSPESTLFQKGRLLYGLHETGRYIRSNDRMVLVEGYTDLLSMYQSGICDVAAVLGTALTAEHIRLIKRHTQHVLLLLDGDEAGMNAAERSLPLLLEAGVYAKACFLPEGMDPDEYIRIRGAEELQLELGRASELFFLVLGRWLREFKGAPSEKLMVVEKLAGVLSNKNVLRGPLQELYFNEVARRLDVSVLWLRRALQSISNPSLNQNSSSSSVTFSSSRGVSSVSSQSSEVLNSSQRGGVGEHANEFSAPPFEKISLEGAPREEVTLLALSLKNPQKYDEIEAEGVHSLLSHSGVIKAFQLIRDKYRRSPEKFATLSALLVSLVDRPELLASCLVPSMSRAKPDLQVGTETRSEVQSELETEEELEDKNWMRLKTDSLYTLRRRFLQRQAEALAIQIKDNPSPQVLEEFMKIQKERHSLTRDILREKS